MSSQTVSSINVDFDSNGLKFNKPFLEKEIFVEQNLNGKNGYFIEYNSNNRCFE